MVVGGEGIPIKEGDNAHANISDRLLILKNRNKIPDCVKLELSFICSVVVTIKELLTFANASHNKNWCIGSTTTPDHWTNDQEPVKRNTRNKTPGYEPALFGLSENLGNGHEQFLQLLDDTFAAFDYYLNHIPFPPAKPYVVIDNYSNQIPAVSR
ncbi:hypothetical protein Q1695_008883 [Nippostrongylus brasiliensis]|nr:hypothetical protein Q1695_008883 [Nippostrongylus brasiliensis]